MVTTISRAPHATSQAPPEPTSHSFSSGMQVELMLPRTSTCPAPSAPMQRLLSAPTMEPSTVKTSVSMVQVGMLRKLKMKGSPGMGV